MACYIKILFLLFTIINIIYSKSSLSVNIQPKDSETIESRTMDSSNSNVRGEGNFKYFLVFFDQNQQSCSQQGYINIAAPRGNTLKLNEVYNDIVGEDSSSRTKALLNFYYTEPKGLRYHCFDNIQVGSFTISDLFYNHDGDLTKISLSFKLHCVVNGTPEKRGVTGKVTWSEKNYSTSLKEIEIISKSVEDKYNVNGFLKFLA